MNTHPAESDADVAPSEVLAAVDPAVPAAPPVIAGQLQRAPPAWPTAIGVIGVVVGVLGALQAASSLAWPIFAGFFKSLPRPPGEPDPFGAMDGYMPVLIPLYIVGVLLGILLSIAGIAIVRRRAWGVPATKWWAIIKIVYGIALSIVTAFIQHDQMQAVLTASAAPGRGAGPPPGFMNAMTNGVVVVTLVFMLLWVAALPAFMLIWFTRSGVKSEVATWRAPSVS